MYFFYVYLLPRRFVSVVVQQIIAYKANELYCVTYDMGVQKNDKNNYVHNEKFDELVFINESTF